MVAWVLVALILLGLPLLGWWIGSQRAWTRIEAMHDGAVRQERDRAARHRLTAEEQSQIVWLAPAWLQSRNLRRVVELNRDDAEQP